MSRREAIIGLYQAGKSNSEVIKLLKLPKSIVYHVVSRFRELGKAKNRLRRGRPRSAQTKKMIKAVRERIARNPERSTRNQTIDMRISNTAMRSIVEKDLKLSHTRWGTIHSKAEKAWQRESFSHGAEHRHVHDRGYFSLLWKSSLLRPNSTVKKSKVLAKGFQNIPEEMRIVLHLQKPLSVMVRAAVPLRSYVIHFAFRWTRRQNHHQLLHWWYFGFSS